MKEKALRLWPWLAAIATGLLYRGCFAPFDQAWLCWIALTPLLAAVWFSGAQTKRRALRDLLLGYVAGLVFFWSVFSWLRTVTVPGLVLVGLYMAVYMAAWAWLCGRLRPRVRKPKAIAGLDAVTERLAAKRALEASGGAIQLGSATDARPPRRGAYTLRDGYTGAPADPELIHSPWLSSLGNLRLAFLAATAWVTVELLRGVVFSGWGWNTLGSALHGQWALIQIVEFTGVPGLSFLVAFTNVVLVATVRRFIVETRVKPIKPHYDLTITLASIVGVCGFGIRAVQTPQEAKLVRMAAVQSNIPREEKFNPQFAKATFDKFAQLSQVALRSQPALLLWPESSMPDPMVPGTESYDFVMQFSSEIKTDLLLGVIDEDGKDAYNAAVLVSGVDRQVQLYRKVHLVPFGEYVPGRHTLPGIGAIVGDQVPADFGFGKEHTVFRSADPDVRLAPLICFEDTIGELTRQFVLRGANVLANVTNDGWFLETSGSQQHLANAVFRCVETRLPMVRAANTGVTCFINEFGRVTQRLLDEKGSQFTEGVLSSEVRVPITPRQTFYVRHGELFAQICAGVTALTFIVVLLRSFRRKGTET